MKKNGFLGLFFLLIISCSKEIIFEEYKFFENQIWNYEKGVFFNYLVVDTISQNKVIIKVRHTTEYEFQNLFLLIDSEGVRDTVELKLADKEGSWLGSGIGDVREHEILYKKNMIFSQKKKIIFEVTQAMRYRE